MNLSIALEEERIVHMIVSTSSLRYDIDTMGLLPDT